MLEMIGDACNRLHTCRTNDNPICPRALGLCGNSAERAYLQQRLDEMLNFSA
jgi:hypothetical protein